ncbi:MAG: methyltransferase domain-containing protein [Elusimicrobia bacterium]|nr:methyltransferase domain-containing protein [Elusimicrobiota bacterium]
MPHIFDPEDRHKLDNPERRSVMPPDETLVKAGIKPGDVILDVGCGMGYFAIPASRMVGPKGMIYAVDASGVMLAELRSRTAHEGIFNIQTSQTRQSKLEIPAAEYTLALLVNVLHEVEDRKAFLSALAAALKPGVKLSVIEWKKAETPAGPPLKERLSEDEIQVLLKKAGFTEPAMTELTPSSLLYTCSKK